MIDGRRCVTKRYNAYRDPPAVKLDRELAFYRAYAGVPILPKLVAHRVPDSITISHVPGERCIERIDSGEIDAEGISEVSRHYGTLLSQFFASRGPAPGSGESNAHIAATIKRIAAVLDAHPNWRAPAITETLPGLDSLPHAGPPMMCKTDWSASNMLVDAGSAQVTCLYDFDTAYPGNRLTFLGDILCSASVRLDWPAIRDGLTSLGVAMPEPKHLAAAAHFSRWQVQLARATPDDLGWPGPARFGAHLEQLTQLAQA